MQQKGGVLKQQSRKRRLSCWLNVVFLLSLLCGCTFLDYTLSAQSFRLADEIDFSRGSHLLSDALMGGLDNPQFSQIDLDQDGDEDLAIFDKTAQRFFTFLKADGLTAEYSYAPEYESIFPELLDWALLVDYNCDGLQDIFSYFSGAVQVYTAGLDAGEISFSKLTDRIRYGTASTPVPGSRVDLPAIGDMDNDGDIDILNFGSLGGYVRYYQNQSVENGWGCDSLVFDLVSNCWGDFFELSACAGGDLFSSCKGGEFDFPDNQRMHAGSTLCMIDKDGNGVQDLMVGDLSCNNVVFLRNGGTTALAAITSQDINFPSEDVSVHYAGFLAPFHLDLDGDGRRDILFAPNDDVETQNVQQVWHYKNVSPDSVAPVFQQDSFLTAQMVDAGSQSKVVPFDADADGLLDLVVGVGRFQDATGQSHGLSLYKNVGTLNDPAYRLESRDYAGLGILMLEYLAPAFGDLDGDGDLDMLLGTGGGDLHYYSNTAAAGTPANFVLSEPNFEAINQGEQATPVFFDLNKDGKLDLVVGERNGNLNYYRNIGSVSDPQYLLDKEVWGAVDVRRGNATIGFSAPWLLTTEIGTIELYVGSLSGYLYRYSNIDGNLLGTFTLEDSSWLGLDLGRYSTITAADINNDDRPELLLGNVRGGLSIYTEKGTPSIGIDELTELEIEIFPNPVRTTLSVNWKQADPPSVRIYDIAGRLFYQQKVAALNDRLTIAVDFLPAGLYLLELSNSQTTGQAKFVKN